MNLSENVFWEFIININWMISSNRVRNRTVGMSPVCLWISEKRIIFLDLIRRISCFIHQLPKKIHSWIYVHGPVNAMDPGSENIWMLYTKISHFFSVEGTCT